MKLPQMKMRGKVKFELVDGFNSKLDAQRELKRLRNENAFFGKKKFFVFSSTNPNIIFNHGVYEQTFYVK